jgi:hypothetical protein
MIFLPPAKLFSRQENWRKTLTMVAKFSWYNIPKWENNMYNKSQQKRPNVHKIYQHLPLQEPPKITQIWKF